MGERSCRHRSAAAPRRRRAQHGIGAAPVVRGHDRERARPATGGEQPPMSARRTQRDIAGQSRAGRSLRPQARAAACDRGGMAVIARPRADNLRAMAVAIGAARGIHGHHPDAGKLAHGGERCQHLLEHGRAPGAGAARRQHAGTGAAWPVVFLSGTTAQMPSASCIRLGLGVGDGEHSHARSARDLRALHQCMRRVRHRDCGAPDARRHRRDRGQRIDQIAVARCDGGGARRPQARARPSSSRSVP